jgi:hypothetical protein
MKFPSLHLKTPSGKADPVRDWLTLLTFAGLILAALIGWNVWIFERVASGGALGEPEETAIPSFSRSSLDTIHTIFTTREGEEAKYVSGTYRYADPSE